MCIFVTDEFTFILYSFKPSDMNFDYKFDTLSDFCKTFVTKKSGPLEYDPECFQFDI